MEVLALLVVCLIVLFFAYQFWDNFIGMFAQFHRDPNVRYVQTVKKTRKDDPYKSFFPTDFLVDNARPPKGFDKDKALQQQMLNDKYIDLDDGANIPYYLRPDKTPRNQFNMLKEPSSYTPYLNDYMYTIQKPAAKKGEDV